MVGTPTERKIDAEFFKLSRLQNAEKSARERVLKCKKKLDYLMEQNSKEKLIEDRKKLEAANRREIREFKVELAAQRRAEREITC